MGRSRNFKIITMSAGTNISAITKEKIQTLNSMQVNILAVALDHMWEHLVSLKENDFLVSDKTAIEENKLIEERIQSLTDMQTLFNL
jgi:hypothetical protein|tara:strand:+ start:227 stop:487 length:261 start_codon:yes stop_codon:yes gene_type:complete